MSKNTNGAQRTPQPVQFSLYHMKEELHTLVKFKRKTGTDGTIIQM